MQNSDLPNDFELVPLSYDEVLAAMSRKGLTITEAIRTARNVLGIGLGEAKVLVANHPAWAATAEAARPLHDEFLQAFQDIAEPRPQSEPLATSTGQVSYGDPNPSRPDRSRH